MIPDGNLSDKEPKMNSSRSEQTAQAAQRILERLKSSGGKGLTKKVLAKKKHEEQALKELVRAGKVANLGAANSSYYLMVRSNFIVLLRIGNHYILRLPYLTKLD
jgi:hypothetical protein